MQPSLADTCVGVLWLSFCWCASILVCIHRAACFPARPWLQAFLRELCCPDSTQGICGAYVTLLT